MKTKFITILMFVMTLLLVANVTAQTTFNPNNQKMYYSYALHTAKAYTTNTVDTSATITIGGARYISFTVTPLDTALMDYYIDYKVVGTNTSWTNALTDSLINNGATSNSGKTQEYIFRNNTVEKYGGLVYQVRTRKAWRNVTQGTSTATFTEKVNYKP